MKKAARQFLVAGRVQGVGFRFFVEREANELGLRGYVRNLSDGRVEVHAEGDESALASLRERLERGPLGSRVERVEEREAAATHHKEFVVEPTRYTSS
jgi:acylphosphatase